MRGRAPRGFAAYRQGPLARLQVVAGYPVHLEELSGFGEGDRQGGFGQAVDGIRCLGPHAVRGRGFDEPLHYLQVHRLRPVQGQAQAAQVEAGEFSRLEQTGDESIGEVGSPGDGAPVLAQGAQPQFRPGDEELG